MKDITQITATIVLYKEDAEILQRTVNSFLKLPLTKKLYLIDNSPNAELAPKFDHPEIIYKHNPNNIGFGRGHNMVLDSINKQSQYHLVLNPDVEFTPKVISTLIDALKKDETLAMVAPKVVCPDGTHQYTCRKYPKFIDLFYRIIKLNKTQIYQNEYRGLDLTQSFYPDFIHGCFFLFKTASFIKLKGFDERFFLYMEDADICKRIDQIGQKKMYCPKEEVIHIHRKGSAKNFKLFFTHLISAIKYFNKWGY